ncbi:IdeS/Mac family cysteine endopeptidase, partial [Mycoplasma elephantis]|uniref:IdeS/Mac family cysteine endopeptidase n=1 Tax=Mycoplasma elephantis TaxID=114882 RepID=UPI000560FFFD
VLASGTEIKPENGVYKITLNKNEEIKVLLKDNVTKINSEISKKLKNNNAESINLKEYANKTLFAYGITKENGWYDHDKLSILGINAPDNSYCWASTASGWIKWFFVQMSKEGYKIPEKYLINSEKYRSIIFEKFVENFNNTGSGGKTYFGLDYFLWKKYIYQNTTESFKIDNPRDKNDNGFGAFFEILKESGINEKSIDIEITSNKSGDKLENYMITTKDNKILKSIAFEEFMGYQYNKYGNKYKNRLDYFSKTVINALNNGGVVAILPNDGGHVINVWGVETNNAGIVNKLYITDSDDVKKYGKNKLICLELKENHGALFLNNYIGNGIFRGWQVFYKFPFTISELREIIKDN